MDTDVITDNAKLVRFRQEIVARGILILAAIGAIVSWVGALASAFDTDSTHSVVAVHDMLSFPVYAVLFLILAKVPRRIPGIWEVLIAQKAIMAILAFTVLNGDEDAKLTGAVDGILALLLIVAYLFARGHRAWYAPSAA